MLCPRGGPDRQRVPLEPAAAQRPSPAIVSGDLDILTGMPSRLAELLADPVDPTRQWRATGTEPVLPNLFQWRQF